METTFEKDERFADTGAATSTPPYLPFVLFDGFLSSLAHATLPSSFSPETLKSGDRDISDSDRRLLFRTLIFLGLLTDAGEPAVALATFVNGDPSSQERVLRNVLLSRYPKQVIQSLATDDKAPVKEYFDRFALSERVKRSCTSFLIHATEKAGFPVSSAQKLRRRPVTHQPALQGPSTESHPQAQGPMVTHLTLGWRRTCTLTHNFELTKSDIRKIRQLLDIITDSDQETDDSEA